MKIILSSLAARELVEESMKYESKAPSLGALFIDEFESAIRQLPDFPQSGHVFGNRFRRLLMKRFPYSVVYGVSNDVLRIVAIMHQQRGPEFITERLELKKTENA